MDQSVAIIGRLLNVKLNKNAVNPIYLILARILWLNTRGEIISGSVSAHWSQISLWLTVLFLTKWGESGHPLTLVSEPEARPVL